MSIIERMKSLSNERVGILKDGPYQDLIEKCYTGLENKDYPLRGAISDTSINSHCHQVAIRYSLLMHDLAVLTDARIIVELGTREGCSLNGFIRAMSRVNGHVYTYDPALGYLNKHIFVPDYLNYCSLFEQTGEEGYKDWPKDKLIDLLYIDTDPHSYEQTKMWLSEYWINNVRPGGYIILDDAAVTQQIEINSESSYSVLRPLIEYVDENENKIEFAVLFWQEGNGIGVIKLEEKE